MLCNILQHTGEQMSPSNHADLFREWYKNLGVAPTKLTHELRVFAAQAMHEMGVSLEVRSAATSSTNSGSASNAMRCALQTTLLGSIAISAKSNCQTAHKCK
jgi:hypothetical protein